MKTLNLNRKNRLEIINYFEGKKTTLEGLKLRALYRLIQIQGERISAPENEYLDGVKVIEYTPAFYGGLKWKKYGAHYWPAQIKVITLKKS